MSSFSHLKLHDGLLYIVATLLFMILILILYCTYKYVDRTITNISRRSTPRSSAISSRKPSFYQREDARPLTTTFVSYGPPEILPTKNAPIFQTTQNLTEHEKAILQIHCEECDRLSCSTKLTNSTYIP